MIYAGIGSRETPIVVQQMMTSVAQYLSSKGWTLSSGGAGAADSAFESGAGRRTQIWLPWKGLNGNPSELYYPSPEAMKLASSIHPAWGRCSEGARKLHARNMHQVLGADLNTPVQFVICWTKDGQDTGGTGQAIRLAWSRGIKVINMFHKGWEEELEKQIKRLKVVHIKSPITPGWDRLYCGRTGKGEVGTYGNPFAENVTDENRDEVCDKFEVYMRSVIESRGEGSESSMMLYQGLRSLYKRIKAGERIELACFCAPKRCHCESIKNFIEEKIFDRNENSELKTDKNKVNSTSIEEGGR